MYPIIQQLSILFCLFCETLVNHSFNRLHMYWKHRLQYGPYGSACVDHAHSQQWYSTNILSIRNGGKIHIWPLHHKKRDSARIPLSIVNNQRNDKTNVSLLVFDYSISCVNYSCFVDRQTFLKIYIFSSATSTQWNGKTVKQNVGKLTKIWLR